MQQQQRGLLRYYATPPFFFALSLAASLPFSFTFNNLPSSVLLPTWSSTSTVTVLDELRTQNKTVFFDASTGFVLTYTATTYAGLSPAVRTASEWLLLFSANGTTPTPPLCNVSPLNVTLADQTGGPLGTTELRRYKGSFGSALDYAAVNLTLASNALAVAPPSPPSAPPIPPLLPGIRVWGTVTSTTRAATPEACRDDCIAAGDKCNSMAWANITGSYVGCWLCLLDYTEVYPGFVSWIAPPSPPPPPPPPVRSATWAPLTGRSSDGELPYFGVHVPATGEGRQFSIGWSGNWVSFDANHPCASKTPPRKNKPLPKPCTPYTLPKQVARAARDNLGATQVTIAHPTLCAPLLPGEALRSMRVVDIAFDANTPESFHAGVNAHRRLVTRYKLPRASKGSGEPMGALVASWSWIGWADGPSLADQLWHVWAVKNSSSVEAYWLDAGWFWGGFPAGVGNWQLPISGAVNTSKFPGGTLAPLGVVAHAQPNPVQFIVWFEPERVAKGTWIDLHHPEFLLQAGGSSNKLLNLGNAVARDFITTYLSSAVGNYSLDVLRLDFNFDPAPHWAAGDVLQGNRSGVTELAYVEGLYRMWDTCMEEHPGLLIDDCSSGGRRIDLETLSRSVPLWRSDNPGTSEQQQVQSMGLSGFAPISSGGVSSWLPYPWRSSGIVGKTIDWGRAGWEVLLNDTSEMALLRAAVAETQRLRPLAIFGDYYPLTPIAQGGPWGAYQVHCPRDAPPGTCVAGAGFAYVFLRPTGPPFGSFVANLFAIEPAAACVATLRYGYSVNATLHTTGAQLAALNITFSGGATSESVLLEYTCA